MVHSHLELGPTSETHIRAEAFANISEHIKAVENGSDILGTSYQVIKRMEDNLNVARVMALAFWDKYPTDTNLQTIVREQEISDFFLLEGDITVWLAGRLDNLSFYATDASYWVKDIKTTSLSPEEKLVGYEWGPQKRIYRLLATSYIQRIIGLKNHTGPKGFILNVIQTPGIRLSGEDRDYTIEKHILKSGPRKGETEDRKVFDGEPKFENYVKRCKDWYAKEAITDPIRSFMIPFSEEPLPRPFQKALMECTLWEKKNISDLPLPKLAEIYYEDPTATHCYAWGGACDYYPLCQKSCDCWKNIIEASYKQEIPEIYLNEVKQIVSKEQPIITSEEIGHAGHES